MVGRMGRRRSVNSIVGRAAMVLYADTGAPTAAEQDELQAALRELTFCSVMASLEQKGLVPGVGGKWGVHFERQYDLVLGLVAKHEAENADAD